MRAMPSMRGPPPKTVDEYLRSVPKGARAVLQGIRRTIREAAPDAIETIGYQIPMYKYHGNLVSFAAFSDHLSFFPMSLECMEGFEEELRRYDRSKGTIRFPVDNPMTASLVRKLVKARMKENLAREAGRRRPSEKA